MPAHRVERDVAEYYLREVKLDAERVAELLPRLVELFRLTTGYREREAARHRRKVDDILGQRRQLVADHLANPRAIPLDVLAEQQNELGQKLAAARQELEKVEADVGRAEEGLRLAHEFLTDTSATYREQADPRVRRRWNQIFFTKIYVTRRGIVGTELTDEFGALLADDLAAKLEKMPSDPARFRTRGSNSACLVELGGLEPPTSWVRSRRSPN